MAQTAALEKEIIASYVAKHRSAIASSVRSLAYYVQFCYKGQAAY